MSNIDPILGFDPWFLYPPKDVLNIKHSGFFTKIPTIAIYKNTRPLY